MLGDLGLSLTLAAVGSAMGTGVAGMSAIGVWKKAYLENKAAPFIIIAFVGAPLTQTIYGLILRNAIFDVDWAAQVDNPLLPVILVAAAGIAMGFSAFFQGKAGARASDALGETGEGFGNYIIVVGIVETVALFVMVFSMIALP